MTRPHFCGVGAGPRTIFSVAATSGYSISAFSAFGADEAEVLFRPLSTFQVKLVKRRILDPKETVEVQRSGFPDDVFLEQVDLAQDDDDDGGF